MTEDIRAAYLHFPFCVRKCPYCDFVSYAGCMDQRSAYIDAICREIELTGAEQGSAGINLLPEGGNGHAATHGQSGLSTIYMGGGTPSLFSPVQISAVITKLRETFGIRKNAEITLEVNPGTVDEASFRGFREAGINRISIGVQSFSPALLVSLGRIHTSGQAVDAIHAAQAAGFANISCDLMTGLAGQTLQDVEDSLSILLKNNVPHVSFYALTIEEGTPFAEKYGDHEDLLPTAGLERDMYHMLVSRLKAAGFRHYEISNCGKPRFESRHNMTYWKALPYFGFGCGAYAYRNGKRTGNTADLSAYLQAMTGPSPVLSDILAESEHIDEEESRKEYMLLGFRMIDGVSPVEFQARYGFAMEDLFGDKLMSLMDRGLILHEDGRYFLSDKGLDYANAVFREFVGK